MSKKKNLTQFSWCVTASAPMLKTVLQGRKPGITSLSGFERPCRQTFAEARVWHNQLHKHIGAEKTPSAHLSRSGAEVGACTPHDSIFSTPLHPPSPSPPAGPVAGILYRPATAPSGTPQVDGPEPAARPGNAEGDVVVHGGTAGGHCGPAGGFGVGGGGALLSHHASVAQVRNIQICTGTGIPARTRHLVSPRSPLAWHGMVRHALQAVVALCLCGHFMLRLALCLQWLRPILHES